jgi:hypothetical protein
MHSVGGPSLFQNAIALTRCARITVALEKRICAGVASFSHVDNHE